MGWTDSGGECNALRLTLQQPARSAQGIYSGLGGDFDSLGVAVSSLTPAAGLDLSSVAGLSSLLVEEEAGGAAFARGFRTSHEVNTVLDRCETGLPETRRTGRCGAVLARPLARLLAATTAGAGAVTTATAGVGTATGTGERTANGAAATGRDDSMGLSTFSAGAAAGVTGNAAATTEICAAGGRVSASAGFCAGATAAGGVVATITGASALATSVTAGAFFPLLFTKTVKTPGASSTVAVPQRFGALKPSRRIRSTLKLSSRGLAWQSGFFVTHTWSQGRFANSLGRCA